MNFLVTCPRHFESETKNEIKNILGELGDDNPKIVRTNFSGIISVDTSANYVQVIKKIREKIEDEPWLLRYSSRWIPIQAQTDTVLDEILSEAIKLSTVIGDDDSYRITIEKRDSKISSQEVIKSIASQIKNKVSLENADWIILVEILGPKTGISVLRPTEILSVEREKRTVSE